MNAKVKDEFTSNEPKPLDAADEKKYASLVANFDSLEDADVKELLKLKKQKTLFLQFREEQIAALKQGLVERGYSIVDLFSKPEVRAAAIHYKLIESATASATSSSDEKIVLASASIENENGHKTQTYNKGRIYKAISAKNSAPFTTVAWPKLLLQHAQTEAAFLKVCTEVGKAYFDTEDGKKELAQIVKLSKLAKERQKS